ncbi:MAG: hydroxylase, partial [Actinomycetota bacterium]|nr:hydroxylase [Actinomycetota bacterium]
MPPADLLSAARDLAPLAAKHAEESEQDRRLAAPVVDALRDAGLFRLCVPKALGGAAAHPST